MSTPWISRPRWTCKYCNITINDDVPSRMQHENGLRHKGNVERSLRETYKKGERERKEERDAKKLMETIEKAAKIRHDQDQVIQPSTSQNSTDSVIVGKATENSSSSSQKTQQKSQSEWKPKDRMSTYGSAIPLHSDQISQQNEVEEKGESGKDEGVVGEWQTVEPILNPAPSSKTIEDRPPPSSSTFSSSFKVREKKARYQPDDEDDDDLLATIKVKKKIRTGNSEQEFQRREEEKQKSMLPQWSPLQLNATNGGVKDEDNKRDSDPPPVEDRNSTDTTQIKPEHVAPVPHSTDSKVKNEDDDNQETSNTSSSSMFKKRKGGSGAGAKKVRAVI